MDLSTMDTAVPISPDRVSLSTYLGLGVDYSSPYFKGEDYMQDEGIDDDWEGLINDLCTVVKIGIPASEKLDVQAKIYQSGYSWGAKLGVKNLFYHQGKKYFALMPMLTHISGSVERFDEDDNAYKDTFGAKGFEMTGLYSYEANKYLTGTLALRYNLSLYKEESNQIQYEDLLLSHGGLSANLRLTLGALMLTYEFGFEVLPNKDSNVLTSPITALGIGLQF
jgi:hypothetical protein